MDWWIALRKDVFFILAILVYYKVIYKYIGFWVKAKKFKPAPQLKNTAL